MRKFAWMVGLLVVPAAAVADEAAAPQEGAQVEKAADEPKFPVGATLVYDNSVGLGTFVANEGARNPDWSMSLSVRPSLTLFDKLSLSLRADIVKILASSYIGSANADVSSSTSIRQLSVGDLMLTAAVPEVYREPFTGIGVGAAITTYIPTGMLSRASTLVTAFRPALTLNWQWEGLALDYGFYYRKNFHTHANPVLNTAALPESLIVRPGGPEDLGDGNIAIGTSRNTSHMIYNYAAASYTLFDALTASVSLYVINYFKYQRDLDPEYSSQYASASGQYDATWGTIDVTYQLWEHLALSVGVQSLQTLYTADNKNVRFPFFDLVSPADNNTAFYFDVTGTI